MYAGLKNSTGDYVVVMDAVLQHPPIMLVDMCKAMRRATIVVLQEEQQERVSRKFAAYFLKAFIK